MKLYVSNLSFSTQEDALANLFASYGEVVSVKIITDRETGRPRGFGFVEMGSAEEGNSAIEGLNGQDVNGRNISVSEAKERTDRPSGGGGFNRGGGNRNGGGGYGNSGGYGRR